MSYQCPECGKPYKSRSGLRKHIKKEHPMEQAGDEMLKRAMKDLGIDWEDVMSHQVYDDRIVIVEGPVGYKRTWWFPASGAKPAG